MADDECTTDDDAAAAAGRFADDALCAHFGIEFERVEPGYAKATLEARKALLNPKGVLHGSALYALADVTAAVADEAGGDTTVGLETSTSYLTAVEERETVTAVAEQEHTSRKTSLVAVDVSNEAGERVVSFTARGYRLE